MWALFSSSVLSTQESDYGAALYVANGAMAACVRFGYSDLPRGGRNVSRETLAPRPRLQPRARALEPARLISLRSAIGPPYVRKPPFLKARMPGAGT